MRLVKGTQTFVTEDATTIKAFKLNGWTEEEEKKATPKAEPKEEPKKPTKK